MAYLGRTREAMVFFNADPETFRLARQLRKTMTQCEKLLWERLRRHNIKGVKFRRQHPIEYYVADFYCHEALLVIEVDGPIHETKEQRIHDENRSAELARFGIKVIRFTNDEMKHRIGWVMQTIREEILARLDRLKE